MELKKVIKNLKILDLNGRNDISVSGIAYDSRKVKKNDLFVAVNGFKLRGSDYINDALKKGANSIISEDDIAIDGLKNVALMKVNDSRQALSQVSANFYGNPSESMYVIGITGTNGKTTVTYLLESILNAAKIKNCVTGTVSYRGPGVNKEAQRTTPESADLQSFLAGMKKKKVTHSIMEVSSHALVLKRLDNVNFDICVFTNLSSDHLDFHGTREAYMEAKEILFSKVLSKSLKSKKYSVLNIDDPFSKRLLKIAQGDIVTYGDTHGDIRILSKNISQKGICAKLKVFDQSFEISSELIGNHNLYNILAAVSVAVNLGIEQSYIQKGIALLKIVPGRLEKVKNDKEINIYIDYAHTDDALAHVINNLNRIKTGRVITVFGCGGDRDREKRPKMGAVTTKLSDITIITSDNPRSEEPGNIIDEILQGVDKNIEKVNGKTSFEDNKKYLLVIPDRAQAIRKAINISRKGDSILVAGKGHEEYQEFIEGKTFFSDKEFVKEVLTS